MKVLKVGIDPGHGGDNIGASANGMREEKLNLEIANLLHGALVGMGFFVVQTRGSDETVSLTERSIRCRACDLIVILHADANTDPTVGSLDTYALPGDEVGICMGAEMERCAPPILRGSKAPAPKAASASDWTRRAYNCIAPHQPRPTVLVEMLFLTNPNHAAFAKDEGGRTWLAATLAQGVACGARAVRQRWRADGLS